MIDVTQADVDGALNRLASGLERYRWIQANLRRRDVSRWEEFQTCFDDFYRVRRNAVWRAAFFALLERSKTKGISFADALDALHRDTGRIEASFASKLVATIDPTKPVIDSIVHRTSV